MSLAGISAGSFFIDSDDESSASAATSAAVNLDGLHLAEEEAGEADGTPSAPAAARPIGAIDQQAEAGAGAAGEPEEGEPSETDSVLGSSRRTGATREPKRPPRRSSSLCATSPTIGPSSPPKDPPPISGIKLNPTLAPEWRPSECSICLVDILPDERRATANPVRAATENCC